MTSRIDGVDIFALCKAVTNFHYDGKDESLLIRARPSLVILPYRGLEFQVKSFDVIWEYTLSPLMVRWRRVEGTLKGNYLKKKGEFSNPWVICCCWLAVKTSWPDLYAQMIAPFDIGKTQAGLTNLKIYTPEFLASLMQLEDYNEDTHIMYLLASAILNTKTLQLGSDWSSSANNIAIVQTDSDLKLYVWGEEVCDWAYMARNLYHHMQSVHGPQPLPPHAKQKQFRDQL